MVGSLRLRYETIPFCNPIRAVKSVFGGGTREITKSKKRRHTPEGRRTKRFIRAVYGGRQAIVIEKIRSSRRDHVHESGKSRR
jgi:hypothetical protein